MKIKIEKNKCTGCHLCEIACSLFNLGVINTEKSAIRIQKDDLNTSMNQPLICRQCKEMKCLEGEEIIESIRKQVLIDPLDVGSQAYIPDIGRRTFPHRHRDAAFFFTKFKKKTNN